MDNLIGKRETKVEQTERIEISAADSFFQRKIQFHLARKPYNTFSDSKGDFKLETLNPNSSTPQKPSTPFKKSDVSDSFERGLDPELSFDITFRRILDGNVNQQGAGLENLGNTCFLNSVLQCLTYTEPLAAYLQSGKHQNSCHIAGFCALCAIQKHVSRALQSTGRILAPKDLVSNLRCISRNFRNARQEDAHEYMVNLLESMHKCCLPSGVPSESPVAYEKSLVHKIFGGRLRSQVKCMQCSYCSNKFDPFLDLSLEIVKADSLHKALLHFTAVEQLDGGERQYNCQRCKQKVKAVKQLKVHKAPYVLTIHLKRFDSHIAGQKIDKRIHFGPTLDLTPFVSDSNEGDLKYTLYGVLVHAGWSTHSGHYYCFVRTSSGLWYSLDDNRVVQVSERTVLDQKAYMLFYVRDRKRCLPKKPVDTVEKQGIVANGIGNKFYSTSGKIIKEAAQNSLTEKRFGSTAILGTVTSSNAIRACSSNESVLTEISSPKTDGRRVAECLTMKRAPALEAPSEVPLINNPVKEHSSVKPKIEQHALEGLQSSTAIVAGSGSTPVLEIHSGVTAFTETKIVDDGNAKELSVSVERASKLNTLENSNSDKPAKGDVTSKIKVPPTEQVLAEKIVMDINSRESYNEMRQVGDAPAKKISRNLSSDKSAVLGENMIETKLVESTGVPIARNGDSQMKAVKGKPNQKRCKSKRMLLKYQLRGMHLSSHILYASSLGVRKKKHKRNKLHTSAVELNLECVFDGPSTSEETQTVFTTPTRLKRKKEKSSSKMVDNVVASENTNHVKDNNAMETAPRQMGGRSDQNGSILATDEQQCRSLVSGSAPNERDAKPDSFKHKSQTSMENSFQVTRWDGSKSDFLLPHLLGSSSSMSIGYIADEWDEEYDRGKRKKVRGPKHIFGGPNLFQEIANQKCQKKKAKKMHHQHRHGNRPFRI
ncbi:Peptidase C19, ubiquitin carboxyl-terminal hydrolase [Dillenia turbinata]|uniref:Ubiquitin carboxyl-terminal hydrolase n=1 Tax=Dillenia turbinata TaxID=194707 RepID=A0AAN8ZRP2_9MAGN